MSSSADIVAGGGAAGGGKSHVVLLEALRHVHRPHFRAVYFRRTAADLRKPRGLWDSSRQIYQHFGARPKEQDLEWHFPSGAWIKMNHLEHESDVHDHQGAEYPLLVLDEATHFSSAQFWYLQSRVRTPAITGMRAYTRLTCNPDPDSFLMREFLDPAGYIDADGYPREEMVGRLRWFVRSDSDDALVWGDSPAQLEEMHPHLFKDMPAAQRAKSFTFVPFRLDDNPSIGADYKAQLLSLPRVDRMRLLYGNWRIREARGDLFKPSWFPVLASAPASVRRVRFWDLAASRRRRSDHTAGLLLSIDEAGLYCVEDVTKLHLRPHDTEQEIGRIARQDGVGTEVWLEQETGAGAEFVLDMLQRGVLRGFACYGLAVRSIGDKLERAKPVSSAAEKQHVRIVEGPWNRAFLNELEAFPDARVHDDQVDALSGAFHALQASGFAVGTASW
jgi:predicted phage terminase large subunit-like protein